MSDNNVTMWRCSLCGAVTTTMYGANPHIRHDEAAGKCVTGVCNHPWVKIQ